MIIAIAVIAALEVMAGDNQNEAERLKITIDKLRTRSRYQDPQKLTAYLIGKGYSYSLVKEVLSEG